ncbi:Adenylate cyclase [Tetrabaena socialis]|uniref:Adenylate cyclase n=1 Tax=Tetrabaena socialis TaxID=47790 RepID=A0A2J7ZZG7_9CHLO|nr:Adenylate cyclase [Tetrabaena socialis]|eukprot:PNH05655.1 Adenylate cyclase [Tetrabaena socialis]
MCDRQWRSAVARGLVLHFVLCAVAWTPGSTQSCPALDVVDVSTRCEAQRKAPASLPIWHSAIEAARTCGDAAGSAAVGSTTVRGVVVASVTAQIFANFSRTMAPALGMQIQADTLPFEKLLNRFTLKLPESAADPGRYDFWMMSAEAMGDASVKGSFLDLSGFVLDDKSIDASDIPATWRGAMSSTYEGTFSALPVVAYVNHLYYRKDIFAAYNMTVPNTHGTFFDPENLGALFTGPAGREALRILQALRRYSLPENASCTDSISYHVGGRCLMTMSWALAFKLGAHVAVNSPVRGKQGVTSLPGSAVVLDRTTNRLVACTKQLCPYAIIVREPRTNESVLVNKVTNLDSLSIAINAYSPLHVQDSTSLWESLPAHVMDMAIKMHHVVFRRLMVVHRAYESATEGDSFILAFWTADAALQYALAVQEAMLALDWPAEVLASPFAPGLSVAHDAHAGRLAAQYLAPSPLLSGILLKDGGAMAAAAAATAPAAATAAAVATAAAAAALVGQPQPAHEAPVLSDISADGFMEANSGAATPPCGVALPASPAADSPTASGQYVPAAGTLTLRELLQQLFPKVPEAPDGSNGSGQQHHQPPGTVIFRGLRIRMGMHSGVASEKEVNLNVASQRVCYSGTVARLAKAVGDVGTGGQIMLSVAALRRLSPKLLSSSAFVLMYAGRHLIKHDEVELYSPYAPALLPRAAWIAEPRSDATLVPCSLAAPVGHMAVAAVCLPESCLTGTSLEETVGLHYAMMQVALKLSTKLGGCLVRMAPGAMLAAFARADKAIQWLLELQQGLQPGEGEGAGQTPSLLKGGVDVGLLTMSMEVSACGHVAYSGSAVKRATALAVLADPGLVLASVATLREALPEVSAAYRAQ